MSFEERLRASMLRADEELPPGPVVDWSETLRKARIGRLVNRAAMGLAAAAIVAVGVIGGNALLGDDDRALLPPIAPPTPTESPSESASEEPAGACISTSLDLPSKQDLPSAVASLRDEIAVAAMGCDYPVLEELPLAGDDPFTYTYGEQDGHPGEYWRRLEESDEVDVMGTLLRVLDLPYCVEDTQSAGVTLYAWPPVQCSTSTEKDWDVLVESGLYTRDEVETFKEAGSYPGYRVGITEDGDWLYFVAGE